mgnify:CR=1 FL=1
MGVLRVGGLSSVSAGLENGEAERWTVIGLRCEGSRLADAPEERERAAGTVRDQDGRAGVVS